MAKEFYETAGITPVYNQGVLRTPGNGTWVHENIGASEQLFADLLEKDIVGGQVEKGFVGDVGTHSPTALPKVYMSRLLPIQATQLQFYFLQLTHTMDLGSSTLY